MGTPLHPVQVAKRLVEADGYLELGLSQLALERLSPLAGDGPFSALTAYMRGMALQVDEHFQDAASALESAGHELPEPLSRQIHLELSECYRRAGFFTQAVNSLGSARGAQASTPAPTTTESDEIV